MSVQLFKLIEFTGCFALFQYNSCVGSITLIEEYGLLDNLFQYNSCVGSIQIKAVKTKMTLKFQYNSCVGSIISNNFIYVYEL